MNLQPRRPPGHANRKALAFAADILRLRGDGHSLAAIREALEDAGLVVSISTVRREAVRGVSTTARTPPVTTLPSPRLVSPSGGNHSSTRSPVAPASAPASLPGRTIAEEFMRGRITNPLLRKDLAR